MFYACTGSGNLQLRSKTVFVIKPNLYCFFFVFRVENAEGGLKLKKKFNIRHKSELLRSTFCPMMSFRQSACVGKIFKLCFSQFKKFFIIIF